MLESGCVSIKNEVNIMMKNVVDIVLGGLTYWIFGFAFSFGRSPLSNSFISFGDFFTDPSLKDPLKGAIYAAFIFQLSFATTATTIVSGAMAERSQVIFNLDVVTGETTFLGATSRPTASLVSSTLPSTAFRLGGCGGSRVSSKNWVLWISPAPELFILLEGVLRWRAP